MPKTYESWFIALDAISIALLVMTLLLSAILFIITVLGETRRTVPAALGMNSCTVHIFFGSVLLSMSLFTLENDWKRRVYHDSLCSLRGYLIYVGHSLFLYSLTSQAFYRYVIIIHPARLWWQSMRLQLTLICSTWIFSLAAFTPWAFNGDIVYDEDNQVCLLVLRPSAPVLYTMAYSYIIPILIIIYFYVRLVRHVRQMSTRATAAPTQFQGRRDLIVVRRIITIIIVLLIFGMPYTSFAVVSFVRPPPRYHYRISIFCMNVAQACVTLAVFKFSPPVTDLVTKLKRVPLNRVNPIRTLS